jgi:phosphate transport system protein
MGSAQSSAAPAAGRIARLGAIAGRSNSAALRSRPPFSTAGRSGSQFSGPHQQEKIAMPRIHFQLQLAELKDKLLAMAALSQQAVESAVDAYLQRDKGLCRFVKQNERAINTAQRELDEMAYDLLAKEQPMAIDLRFILAVIKINGDLERIGDQSMAIARRTKEIMKHEEIELPVDFAAMGEVVGRMIRRAYDDLLRLIQQKPGFTQQAMKGILVAKNLERIADHASNIATDVIFWIRGADVRHQLSMAMD